MLTIVDHGRVREIQLARPPVNALDLGLIQALRAALADAVATPDGPAALILSGAPGRFSGGLDVPALLRLDREGVRELWRAFFALLDDLGRTPLPWVAALTGHSPAGGTVLALFADYRVIADGPYRLGLNEVQVGLAVPDVLLRVLTFVVGQRQAARLATTGLLMTPPEALRIGLVDEIVATPEDVVPRARAWADELIARPALAMRDTRQLARRPLGDALATITPALIDDVVDRWHTPETQATLRALAGRLGKG